MKGLSECEALKSNVRRIQEYAKVLRRVRGGNTLIILLPSEEEEQAELKDSRLIYKPFGVSSGNPSSPNVNRVDTMPITTDPINTTTTTNVAQSVADENLPQLLDSRGGSHVTNVPAFDKEGFTSWKVRFLGEKVMGTFTRLKCLLNDLENNGVTIPQAEVNATFVNSLPRKWLSMNQTQRANNSIKTIVWLHYMESTIMRKDSDLDVEEDQRTSNEFMADLNDEYH
ncbi:hypothetical protein Tco_1107469 [Tanacetum coccineum]